MTTNFKENIRIYLVVGVVGIFLVAPLLLFAVLKGNKGAQKNTGSEYHDPGSGEVVSNPAGKTPENFGGNANQPVYLGFSKLLDIGVSKFQLDAIKYSFEQYGKSTNQTLSEVSLTVASIKAVQHDSNDPNSKDFVTFEVTLNRKQTYSAKVEYFDVTAIRLYLSDPKTSSQAYDSGVIDKNSQDTYGGDGTPPAKRP